jgi:predicted nucleic acid-binding protein
LRRIEQQAAPAISAVTQMELIVGCRNKTELRALERFLSPFRVIGLDERTRTRR